MKRLVIYIKRLFCKTDVGFSLWEYGTCNGRPARRHKLNKNVQFVLWKAGEQGHKEDYWHNFDSSWWDGFKTLKNPKHINWDELLIDLKKKYSKILLDAKKGNL